MIAWLSDWIRGIVWASILLSLIEQLAPNGLSGKLCRFASALALLLVMLKPLSQIADWQFEPLLWQREETEILLQEEQTAQWKSHIEAETEAYIWDKAQSCGCSLVDVEVEARIGVEGIPLPHQVTLTGKYHATLAQQLTQELGIPSERQIWLTKEDSP